MLSRLLLLWVAAAFTCTASDRDDGFVTTSDRVRLHYIEAGSGPSILFVPGWTMPAEIWEPQIEHLSRSFRVVAMDPRSQGRSDKPPEGHYPARRAQDIKEVVDRLKLAPVALAGWSLGVPEVLTYVDRFGSGTLRAVILVDGSVGRDPSLEGVLGSWKWLRNVQEDRPQFTADFVRGMYKRTHPEEYLRKITAASLQTPTNSAVLLLANIFIAGDWRHILPKVERPLLVAITPRFKAEAELIKAKAPSARIEIFEGAGHALFVDDAARFNSVVEEFLRAAP
jgi:non-heme chloroperoxidase